MPGTRNGKAPAVFPEQSNNAGSSSAPPVSVNEGLPDMHNARVNYASGSGRYGIPSEFEDNLAEVDNRSRHFSAPPPPTVSGMRLIDPKTLPKYNGQPDTFDAWKSSITRALRLMRVLYIVEAVETMPTEPSTTQEYKLVDDNDLAAYVIESTLEKEARDIVVNNGYESAKEMWDGLLKHHQKKGGETWVWMFSNAFREKFRDDDTITSYHNRKVKEVRAMLQARELSSIESWDEQLKLACFMNGLPEEWDSWMSTTLRSLSALGTLSYDKLVDAALEEEERQKRRSIQEKKLPKSSSETGLRAGRTHSTTNIDSGRMARGQYGNRGGYRENGHGTSSTRDRSTRPPREEIECFACGEKGHTRMSKYCPKYLDTLQAEVQRLKLGGKPMRGYGTSSNQSGRVANLDDEFGIDDDETRARRVVYSAYSTDVSLLEYWILDTGATTHMTSNRRFVAEMKKYTSDGVVKGLGDREFAINGIGYSKINDKLMLEEVLYCEGIDASLISVDRLLLDGYKVVIDKFGARVSKDGQVVALAERKNKSLVIRALIATEVRSPSTAILNHERLGHINMKRVKEVENLNIGIGNSTRSTHEICEACALGKASRSPFPISLNRALERLDLIHSDVCGPLPRSVVGYKYFVSFTDDHTRMSWIYPVKQKSEVLEKFREFKAMVEKHTTKSIKIIRSDNGGEYTSNEWKQFLQAEGVQHQTTVPYTPQQNGVAERLNRTLLDMARAMLKGAGLPDMFWVEAVLTASYVRNRVPSAALDKNGIPFESWYGWKPALGQLRVFGCIAFALVADTKSKLADRSRKCIMVGYGTDDHNVKGYKLWDLVNRKFLFSRDVSFNENTLYKDKITTEYVNEVEFLEDREDHDSNEAESQILAEDTVIVDSSSNQEPIISPKIFEPPFNDAATPQRRRSMPSSDSSIYEPIVKTCAGGNSVIERLESPVNSESSNYEPVVQRNAYKSTINSSIVVVETDPESFDEASNSGKSANWLDAMRNEYNALVQNKTWTLVEVPPHCNVIGGKWVYTTKRDGNGNVLKYKARWVAKGYAQVQGLDYDETYAPTSHLSTIRLILAICAAQKCHIRQLDVTTAFLNGVIEEEQPVYLEQPPGFIDLANPNHVCRLEKTLYGLKQAPRAWYELLKQWLISNGFSQLRSDLCVYKAQIKGTIVVLLVYVDDMIIASSDSGALDDLENLLESRFKMTKGGNINWFLGMTVSQDFDRKTIRLCQRQYIVDTLRMFNMSDCHPVSTPMVVGSPLYMTAPYKPFDLKVYQQAIGKLLYLTRCTRPDITTAVGILSQFVKAPLEVHWNAVKRVLRYLKGTMEFQLELGGHLKIAGWSDADWAGDLYDRRSRSGILVYVGVGPIIWNSVKQQTVARSTSEAEYVALASTASEILWIISMLKELNAKITCPVTIFEDNRGCKLIAENASMPPRIKHIDIAHHFIRDVIEKGTVIVEQVPTESMVADIMTKALPFDKFMWCFQRLSMS